jgi:thiol-disulfide isomerase/thioredoxin
MQRNDPAVRARAIGPSRRSALAALAAAIGGVVSPRPVGAAGAPAPPIAEVPVGGTLPDVTMRGLNGPDRRLSAYRGRPLIINVWASWCGPCRLETASLERLAWQDAEGFAVIGISTDDYRDNALRWLRASNATLSHFIDHELQLESLLGASSIPLTVLVDAQGRIVEKVRGAKEWDGPQARALIRRAFTKTPAPRP